MKDVSDDPRRKRAVRNALLLGLGALAIYLGYVAYFFFTGGPRG